MIVTEDDGTEVWGASTIHCLHPKTQRFDLGDLTRFEALTGGAFDRISCQHSGEFDQIFSKKSNARGFARGGHGWFWN